MRGLLIGMSFPAVVLALGATQPVTAGRQQTTVPGEQTSGGEQGVGEAGNGDEMLGKSVQDQQGQDYGDVVALAIRSGRTVYLLVAKEGDPGELTPIPYTATQFDSQTDTVFLIGRSGLAQAPTLGTDELQRLDDPEFERQVHSYYGQEPVPAEKPFQGSETGSVGSQQQ